MLRSLSSTLWKNGRKLRLVSFKSHPREPLDQKYATLDDDSPADGAGCLSAVEVEASAGDDGDFLLLQLTHMPREVSVMVVWRGRVLDYQAGVAASPGYISHSELFAANGTPECRTDM